MRRSSVIAAIALLVLALAGGGIASAHQGPWPDHPVPQHQAVSFDAHAGPAVQGRWLQIVGQARHVGSGVAVTAQAVVHLASGDVTVDLVPCSRGKGPHGSALHLAGHGHHRHDHRGQVLKARVPVSATETPGPITVVVTFSLDGVAQQPSITLDSEVVAPLPHRD
jgi:hypothetical protein